MSFEFVLITEMLQKCYKEIHSRMSGFLGFIFTV